MKKGWKIFWIVIAVFAILGVLCSGAALVLGVNFYDYSTRMEMEVQELKEELHIGHSHYEERENSVVEYADVTKLDIQVGACDVFLIADDRDTIVVDTTDLNYSKKDLELYEEKDGGTLRIWTIKDGEEWDIFQHRSVNCGVLRIYVPRDLVYEQADLSFGASSIMISGLQAEQIHLQTEATELEMSQIMTQGLEAKVGATDFEFSGEIRGDVEILVGSGDAELDLIGVMTDYNYDIECEMGEIEIGNQEIEGVAKEQMIDNGAAYTMDITCRGGSVSVDFQ